jgi:hypothetical protein
VQPLADLLAREISPEKGRANAPTAERLEAARLLGGSEKIPHAFQIAVFNALLAQRDPLGIDAVWQCRKPESTG